MFEIEMTRVGRERRTRTNAHGVRLSVARFNLF